MALDRLDRLKYTVQLFISGKYNECRVRSWTVGLRFETAGDENLVMLLADFAGSRLVRLSRRQDGMVG